MVGNCMWRKGKRHKRRKERKRIDVVKEKVRLRKRAKRKERFRRKKVII